MLRRTSHYGRKVGEKCTYTNLAGKKVEVEIVRLHGFDNNGVDVKDAGGDGTAYKMVAEWLTPTEPEDICGFCGKPGADKIPHPVRWPGEQNAGTEFVHSECENEECGRAHALLTDKQREGFLRGI